MPLDLNLRKRLIDIVRMRQVIHPRAFRNESQLMMTRWFDYRFQSPIELTNLFREKYVTGLKQYVRRHVDIDLASSVTGTHQGFPAHRTTWFSSLWAARQRTDLWPVPYEMLINFSFDFSSRRKRHWSLLPNQLHPSDRNREVWLDLFEKAIEDMLPLHLREVGNLPHYRVENDRALPPQLAFRAQIREEMQQGQRSLAAEIAERVFEKRHLCLTDARGLISSSQDPDEILSRARSNFDADGGREAPRESLAWTEMLPSCFGIAEANDPSSSPCSNCPLASECAKFGELAISLTIRASGAASPVLEADRARSRRNVAAHRRKKTAATATKATEPEAQQA